MMGDPEDKTNSGRQQVSQMGQPGWHVTLIPRDDGRPSLAYSLGLYKTFGHPEMVVFGSDLEAMNRVINRIAEEVSRGRRFTDGESLDGIVEGYKVSLDEVPWHLYADRGEFAHARRF